MEAEVNTQKKVESWMFRMPHEFVALIVSVTIVIILGVIFSLLNIYILIFFILFLVYVKLQQSKLMGSAVRIHQNQFPEIYEFFKNYCLELEIPRASLYIVQDPYLNAYATGLTRPYVVLHSSTVEQLSINELKFVIAHELGHIKAGHNIISSFINPLGTNNPVATYIFALWQRQAEYGADRCGLILTKDIDTGISALLKLTIGGKLYDKLNIQGYAQQIRKAETLPVKASEFLVDHPYATNRIKNLILYWKENFSREGK